MTATHVGASAVSTAPVIPSCVAGDILVLTQERSSSSLPTLPGGWTAIGDTTSAGSSPTIRMSYKVAAGTEGGTTVTLSNGKGQVDVLRGIDTTSPVADWDVYGIATSASTYPVPSITADGTGNLLLVGAVANSSSLSFGAITGTPTGWTEVSDDPALPASQVSFVVWAGSGATGALTAHPSVAQRGCAMAVAFRPGVVADMIPVRTRTEVIDFSDYPLPVTLTQTDGPTVTWVESPSNVFTVDVPFPLNQDVWLEADDGTITTPVPIGAPNARIFWLADGSGGVV